MKWPICLDNSSKPEPCGRHLDSMVDGMANRGEVISRQKKPPYILWTVGWH